MRWSWFDRRHAGRWTVSWVYGRCLCPDAGSRGLGVAIGGCGAGALQLVNPVAQAYAERSPVLVIGGAPGVAEPELHPLLDGRGDPGPLRQIFAPITTASVSLDDPDIGFREIERVLAAVQRETRPAPSLPPRRGWASTPSS